MCTDTQKYKGKLNRIEEVGSGTQCRVTDSSSQKQSRRGCGKSLRTTTFLLPILGVAMVWRLLDIIMFVFSQHFFFALL